MDDEILKTVESMLGKDIKIVDCQKNTSVREEEILLINGIPVTLEGDDGDAIKTALMTGQVPPCDLLNQLLYQAGILRQPVQLETSLSVKSSTLTKEEITVAREGVILDERTSETKEDNYYTSQCKEIWQPVSSVNDIAKRIPIKSDSIPEDKNDSSIKPTNSIINNNKSTTTASKHVLSSSPESFTSTTTTAGRESFPTDSSISNSITTSSIASNLSTDCAVPINNSGAERKRTGGQEKKLLSNFSSDILNCKTFEKNSSLSCDSGHDDIFNSLSQTNLLQTANTENSISSCYDFISSDEADFYKASTFSPDFNKHSTHKNSVLTSSVFGTATSEKFPKENINRKGLPQTTSACIPKCDDKFISSSSLNQEFQNEILETDDNALVYRDGNLISGPLDGLIQHMVPTSDYYPDRSYIFAFLLSARLFIRPYELLAKICQLCDEQQNFSSKSEQQATVTSTTTASSTNLLAMRTEKQNTKSDERLQKFARHLVQLLAEWIDTFPYDFRDERVMQHVRSMTRKCINIDSELKKEVSTILQDLLHRLTVLEKYEEFLQSLARYSNDCFESQCLLGIGTNIAAGCGSGNASGSIISEQSSLHQQTQNYHQSQQHPQHSATVLPTSQINSAATSSSSLNSTTSIDISEMCSSPNLLASQLTHIELERLSHIGPEEFVQAFAKENSNFEQSFNDIKRTRNLESYVQWFNRLSYLVATEIVKHAKKKQRVKIVEYWIETARECFNIGNFNSLMAIIAGLNMSPISRLKKTWAKVQSAKFAVLEHQMDPSSNFNSYRSTLKAAMWRSAGATDERERIVIPFFSLLVKDLYFLNEGCSNKLPNGHINFEKFWQLAKQVTEFIAWKQVTCPFEKLPKVIMFLQTNNVFNENTLAMASFECEPPENHEKDRYKCLKSEQQQQQQNTTHQ